MLAVSAGIRPNWSESARIEEKKKKEENRRVVRWTPCWDESSASAAALELHLCFLARSSPSRDILSTDKLLWRKNGVDDLEVLLLATSPLTMMGFYSFSLLVNNVLALSFLFYF